MNFHLLTFDGWNEGRVKCYFVGDGLFLIFGYWTVCLFMWRC